MRSQASGFLLWASFWALVLVYVIPVSALQALLQVGTVVVGRGVRVWAINIMYQEKSETISKHMG